MKKDVDALKIFTRGKSKLHLAVTTFFIILLAITSIVTLTYTYIETSDAALKSARQMMKSANVGISKDVLRYMSMARRTVRATTWSLKDAQNIRDNKAKIFSIISGQLRAQREIFTIIVGDNSGSVLSVGKIFEDPKYSVDKSKSLPPEVIFRSHFVDRLSYPKSEYYTYYNKNFEEIGCSGVSGSSGTVGYSGSSYKNFGHSSSSSNLPILEDLEFIPINPIKIQNSGLYGTFDRTFTAMLYE